MVRVKLFLIVFALVFAALVLSIAGASRAEEDCLPVTSQCAPLVSFDLRDVELSKFLEAVAREYGINMVISSDVSGSVSGSLKDVPLLDALDSIIESRGYVRREFFDGVLMVVEQASEAHRKERGLQVQEFRLKYLDAVGTDIINTISGVLSERGSVMPVAGSNTLVVKDIPLALKRAAALISSLDTEPRQIIVEARMVEIKKKSASQLGINWGGVNTETSGDVFGGLGTVTGNAGVNLPGAASDSVSGGFLGFSVISDRVSMNLKIQALETTKDARIVSSPRVMVAENQKAVIADGTEIIVPAIQAQTVIRAGNDNVVGSSVIKPQVFRAVLGLKVTPRVVSPGRVSLELEVKREWFDYSDDKKVDGVPSKRTKTVSTRVLLYAGETVVIGGIETDAHSDSTARVPLLSRLPLLGALFKSRQKKAEAMELVIFLTPFIVGEDSDVAGAGQRNQEDL